MGVFFKRDKDAGLVVLNGAPKQEFHCKDGLAGARAPGDQCRSSLGQPAAGNLIQTIYSGWSFIQSRNQIVLISFLSGYHPHSPFDQSPEDYPYPRSGR
jgi:hypothetical protein